MLENNSEGAVDTATGNQDQTAPNSTVQHIADDWRLSLPENMQQWDEVKNASDADTFYKQVGDMRSMIGRSLQVPGPDASTEVRENYLKKVLEKTPEVILRPDDDRMDEFYNSLGRPESADKYGIPELPEGVDIDQDSVALFRGIAHDAGLSQKQFEQVVSRMSEGSAQGRQAQVQQRDSELQGLKGEWGLAFEQNIAMAEKVRQEFFPHIDIPVVQLDVNSIKSMHTLAKSMLGEGANFTLAQGASDVMTPSEADQQINEILGNREHAYWDQTHPGHKAAVDKVLKLHEYKRGQTG